MDEGDQKNGSSSAKSGMILPGPDRYFLEVKAHVSSKVATKLSLRHKKTENLDFNIGFLKHEWRILTKNLEFFLINLECSCLFQVHVF